MSRFERPNPASRWDNPLYEICLPDPNGPVDAEEELSQLIDNIASRVVNELLQTTAKVKPNQSTVPVKAAATNYLQVRFG